MVLMHRVEMPGTETTTMVADSTQGDTSSRHRKKKNHSKKRRHERSRSTESGKKKAKKTGSTSKKKTGASKSQLTKENEDLDLDLSKELYSIGHFINDREVMLDEAFQAIKEEQVMTMLPDILKNCPMDEVKSLCLSQLEGMSKKRIRYILAGEEMISSSDTEDSEDEPELQETTKDIDGVPLEAENAAEVEGALLEEQEDEADIGVEEGSVAYSSQQPSPMNEEDVMDEEEVLGAGDDAVRVKEEPAEEEEVSRPASDYYYPESPVERFEEVDRPPCPSRTNRPPYPSRTNRPPYPSPTKEPQEIKQTFKKRKRRKKQLRKPVDLADLEEGEVAESSEYTDGDEDVVGDSSQDGDAEISCDKKGEVQDGAEVVECLEKGGSASGSVCERKDNDKTSSQEVPKNTCGTGSDIQKGGQVDGEVSRGVSESIEVSEQNSKEENLEDRDEKSREVEEGDEDGTKVVQSVSICMEENEEDKEESCSVDSEIGEKDDADNNVQEIVEGDVDDVMSRDEGDVLSVHNESEFDEEEFQSDAKDSEKCSEEDLDLEQGRESCNLALEIERTEHGTIDAETTQGKGLRTSKIELSDDVRKEKISSGSNSCEEEGSLGKENGKVGLKQTSDFVSTNSSQGKSDDDLSDEEGSDEGDNIDADESDDVVDEKDQDDDPNPDPDVSVEDDDDDVANDDDHVDDDDFVDNDHLGHADDAIGHADDAIGHADDAVVDTESEIVVEETSNQYPAKTLASTPTATSDEEPKLEVLELELRARAIRSLMKHCTS